MNVGYLTYPHRNFQINIVFSFPGIQKFKISQNNQFKSTINEAKGLDCA